MVTAPILSSNVSFAVSADISEQVRKPEILTYTGVLFDPFDPKPDLIFIEDIARALSCETRYAGHAPCGFYSVAQHSVLVAEAMPAADKSMALAALLHDAEEAYFKDMPSPIKAHPSMNVYRERAENLRRVIFKKYGVPYAHLEVVEHVDRWMYYVERASFHHTEMPPNGKRIVPWTPAVAESKFHQAFRRLTNE